MKNYRLYETADFVLDDDFIQWALEGKKDAFWKDWLKQNPDKQLMVAEAKRIVQSFQVVNHVNVSEKEIEAEVNKLLSTVRVSNEAPVYRISLPRVNWWAAASVFVLAGICIWTLFYFTRKGSAEKFSYTALTTNLKLVEQVNSSDKPVAVLLPDGSTVNLSPQSRLSYSKDFKDSVNRDVYLSGEGFFSVTKNPRQPFRVFANGIITKVLGTSFTVRSFEKENTIKVTVRTGKVRVYSQNDEPENTGMSAVYPDDILLTPNQEVVFQKKQQKFQKKILERPVIIDPAISLKEMVYEETPVIKVLEHFKKAYGISIVYDEETLKYCTITADLTDESLYSRLDLICKAIDANYEIIDSEIFIRSKGCR